jgi:hypothetical protein
VHLNNASNLGLFFVAVALIAISISLIVARKPVTRFANRHDRGLFGIRNQPAMLNSQIGVILFSVAWIVIGIGMICLSIFVRVSN